jgi:hypothetical protein
MFIQTEETPNPNTLKFIPGVPVFSDTFNGYPNSFSKNDNIECCPMAKKMLEIEDIEGVFLGTDFISVAKNEDADWYVLKPHLLGIIMQQFINNLPVILTSENTSVSKSDETLDDISKKIVQMLDERIRPAIAMDGGDILFDRFESGVVHIKMKGACAGCPSSNGNAKTRN